MPTIRVKENEPFEVALRRFKRTIEKSGGGTQVEVYTVDDTLGAAEAGVQPGDIILEADGQPVSVTSDLLTVRRSHSVGDTIRLTIQRDGQTLTVDVSKVEPAGATLTYQWYRGNDEYDQIKGATIFA